MMLRRSFHLFLLTASLILMQGCGGAGGSTDQNGGNRPDPNNPNDPPPDTNGYAVDLIVEGTTGIAGANGVITRLMEAILPAQAVALTNQKNLKVDRIRILLVDDEGEIIPGGPVANSDYAVAYDNPDGSHTINFVRQYSPRIDLIIEARLSNGVIMRRPLPNTRRNSDNEPYPVNAATEYAMERFFEKVGPIEFSNMLPCPAGTISCSTQPEMKLINWYAMFEGVVDFEIELPEEANLQQALAFLDTKLSFTRFVDKSIDSLLTAKIGGQTAIGKIPEVISSASGNYNGASFGLGLNQGVADPDNPTTVFSNWVSTARPVTDSVPIYPNVTLSSFGAVIVSNLLTGEVPLQRHALAQNSSTAFELDENAPAEPNGLELIQLFASLSTSGSFDYGVLQTQSVTGTSSSTPTGWLTNPYFTSAYHAGRQSSILQARVTDGLSAQLSGSRPPYKREKILEQLNTFSFFAYSQQTTDDPNKSGDEFETSEVAGKQYGVVSLIQRLSDDGISSPVQVQSSIHQWNAISDGQIQQSQPVSYADDLEIAGTWTMGRTGNNDPIVPGFFRSPDTKTFGYSAIASELYNRTIGKYTAYTGRLELNTGSSKWTGMSDPEAQLLTFAVNSAAEGQGIVHAVKLETASEEPLNGKRFRLAGNGFGFDIDTNENFLFHIDDSVLAFNANEEPSLVLNQVRATQNAVTQEVSELTAKPFYFDSGSPDNVTINSREFTYKNAIKIVLSVAEYQDDAAPSQDAIKTPQELILEGFVTDDGASADNGRVLILQMRYGNSIGLVYGFEEKNLSAE